MNDGADDRRVARISVIDPISQAIDWARDVLFRPFAIEKWIVLGFCAWLASLGEGGGNAGGSSSWRRNDGYHEVGHGLRQAGDWVLEHLLPILFIGSIVILVVLAIWLLVTWLSSRGKFMFLDGVVHNRAAVVEPWHRFRAAGNSLFFFRVILGLIVLAIVALILTAAGLIVWARVEAHGADPLFFGVLFLFFLAFLGFVLAMVLLSLAINDFVVPLMYLRGCRVGEAWRELGGLVSSRPGAFILYVLVKIFIAIVVAVIGILFCCLTCCIVLLPYVGTVILLPVHVFLRAFPLYFLGQFGPEFSRFARLGPENEAPEAAST